jgi:hypothetical protein
MKKYVIGGMAVAVALTVIGVTPAAAQDSGTVGLVMMSGSSVGLTIQATDSVAIRPSVAFLRATADNGGLADGDRTSTGWAPGVSALFYVKSWEATRLYVSPQWTYSRTTSSDGGANESKTTGHSLSAMVGAQHNLGKRFAVFGESGLVRATTKSRVGSAVFGKGTNWSTRSTIGAILFF